jgi:hypothetical protein
MTTYDLDRLNALGDRALDDKVTVNELREFNQLLTMWDESTEHDLLDYHHMQQTLSKGY